MTKIFTLVALLVLAGCSSAPQYPSTPASMDYCQTSKTVELHNGATVDSRVVVECTDNMAENWQTQLGIADECSPRYISVIIDGKHKELQVYGCTDSSGRWHRVPFAVR